MSASFELDWVRGGGGGSVAETNSRGIGRIQCTGNRLSRDSLNDSRSPHYTATLISILNLHVVPKSHLWRRLRSTV